MPAPIDLGSATDASAPAEAPSASSRRWALLFYIIGVALLAAAAWAVLGQQALITETWHSARAAPWWLVSAIITLPILSWLCTNGTYFTLTRHYGQVGWWEMAGLIAAAWLLNYLPLRPGMFGRVAYHKAVNKIAVRDSARVIAMAVACTAMGAAIMVGAALAVRSVAAEDHRALMMALVQSGVWLLLAAAAAAVRAVAPAGLAWRVLAALAWRFADMLIWALRYWAAFALLGKPIDFATATGLAAVAQVGMLAPIQFGVREWLIGLWTPVMVVGLTADLVNRAIEVLIAVPLGLASSFWLYRRRTAAAALSRAPGSSTGR